MAIGSSSAMPKDCVASNTTRLKKPTFVFYEALYVLIQWLIDFGLDLNL